MRIEIDEQLEKQLDEIKKKQWISGKGHTETVRYLAKHFHEFESIKTLLEIKLGNLEETLEKGLLAAARKVVSNLIQ